VWGVVTGPGVPAFVRESIRSISTWELLVLIQQWDIDRAWRAEEITTTMRANMRAAPEGLTALQQVVPVQVDGNGLFRYRPASPC